jgi:hypothetical protein
VVYLPQRRHRSASFGGGNRRQLRAARTDPLPGWEWLAELPAQATQQVFKNYLRTWNRFYAGSANPPKSKKGTGRLAVDVPQASQFRVTRLGRRWGEVTIPSAGRIRFRWTRSLPGVSRECPGRITGGRLTKDPLGWHLCFRIEEEAIEVPQTPPRRSASTAAWRIPWPYPMGGIWTCRRCCALGNSGGCVSRDRPRIIDVDPLKRGTSAR